MKLLNEDVIKVPHDFSYVPPKGVYTVDKVGELLHNDDDFVIWSLDNLVSHVDKADFSRDDYSYYSDWAAKARKYKGSTRGVLDSLKKPGHIDKYSEYILRMLEEGGYTDSRDDTLPFMADDREESDSAVFSPDMFFKDLSEEDRDKFFDMLFSGKLGW